MPFGPCVTSKLTFCPSFRVLNPPMLIAEKCANKSSPPSSGVMKPKPFESLNHFTVPVDICASLIKNKIGFPLAAVLGMAREISGCTMLGTNLLFTEFLWQSQAVHAKKLIFLSRRAILRIWADGKLILARCMS